MNEEIIKSILSVIQKSTDRNVTIKALVKLRTDVVHNRDGIILFRNCGGIPPLVRLLQKPHEKILETVLSILGNCCTDKECCRESISNKITNSLVSILKSIPNPLIQCRACRLLGNLAKDTKSISTLSQHNKAFAQSLCMVLEEAIEPQTPTRIMAVRAMRFLLSNSEFHLNLIKSGGLKMLIKLLTRLMKNLNVPIEVQDEKIEKHSEGLKKNQHREKYFEEVARHLEGVRSDIFDMSVSKEQISNDFIMPSDKESADLVVEILKCLHILSEMPSNTLGWELLQINDLGAVVHLANVKSQNRSMALRTLSNFSKSPATIVALSTSGSIIIACELLTATDLEKPLTESEMKHCINIVYMLCGDACNRAKVRRSGTLGKLLEIAKNSQSQTDISLILCVLNYFQYDNMSMNLMLRDGLLSLLIKELDAYINSDDEYRKKRCEEKISRKRKIEDQIKTFSSYKAPKISEDYLDIDSPGSSPKGIAPSSPCSSRSMSPNNFYSGFEKEMECESDTYSPVCSEDEGIDDELENMEVANPETSVFDLMKLLDTASKPDTQGDETSFEPEEDESYDVVAKRSSSVNLPCNAINIIENLIFRVTLMVCKLGELGKKETLNTLIQAVNVFGSTTPLCGSITNIFSESQFFAPIIKQQIVYEVYKMTNVKEIKDAGIGFIDTLTCVAESGYGRGEILRLLQCDDVTQTRTAIAISFIIKSSKLLYHFLTEGGSLYILLKAILNKNDEHREKAADAIGAMSRSIGIDLPTYSLHSFETMCEFDESLDFETIAEGDDVDKMKFIIHQGCSKIPIEFDKKLLTENSEVFNSMLNSDFREGKEGEIQLKNSSVNGIKYFLNLVDILAKNKTPNIPPVYHFDSILEAYELSKLYIMNNMEEILFHMLVYRLDSNNCLRVLEWALKNFNQQLSEMVINYYLCSNISGSEKVKMYRTADYSDLSIEWNQMIVDAVLVKCQNLYYEGNL